MSSFLQSGFDQQLVIKGRGQLPADEDTWKRISLEDLWGNSANPQNGNFHLQLKVTVWIRQSKINGQRAGLITPLEGTSCLHSPLESGTNGFWCMEATVANSIIEFPATWLPQWVNGMVVEEVISERTGERSQSLNTCYTQADDAPQGCFLSSSFWCQSSCILMTRAVRGSICSGSSRGE